MPPPRAAKRLDRTETAALLTRHDIMPTQQRLQIAAILFAEEQHLSAEVLMERVNRGSAKVSKATIYNTLGLFAAEGLIKEVHVDRSKVFYDSNTTPHHHFYDTSTGELIDIDLDEITIARHPDTPRGTVLDDIVVVIRVRREEKTKAE